MIKGKSSKTAELIAKSIILQSYCPQRNALISKTSKNYCQRFIYSQGIKGRLFLTLVNIYAFRRAMYFLESVMLNGIQLHYLARKKYIHKIVTSRIKSGTQQVVILGAGYDGLGLSLKQDNPSINIFELDHPATLKQKEKLNLRQPNIHIPIIINGDNLTNALTNCQFNKTLRTTFIAEGFFMYLSEAQVDTILNSIKQICPTDSSIIFTYMENKHQGNIGFKNSHPIIHWWLKKSSEPFKWASSKLKVISKMQQLNIQVDNIFNHKTLYNEILLPNNLDDNILAIGECIVEASIKKTAKIQCLND